MEADSVLRDVLVSLFRSEGIEVVVCSSLLDIWKASNAGSSNVAIIDVWYGTPRGISNAHQQALRALGRSVPIIVLADETALGESSQAEIGAVAVLLKPFDIEVVLETVVRCRHRRPCRRSRPSPNIPVLN
jgi:DNA-binding NtrC family response regulator